MQIYLDRPTDRPTGIAIILQQNQPYATIYQAWLGKGFQGGCSLITSGSSSIVELHTLDWLE